MSKPGDDMKLEVNEYAVINNDKNRFSLTFLHDK